PALRSARDSARSVSCLSNQRQLGIAMHNYANDSDDHFVVIGDGEINTTFWKLLARCMGHEGGPPTNFTAGEMFGRDYLVCPVKPRPSPDGSISPAGYGVNYLGVSSYAVPSTGPEWYAFGSRRMSDLSPRLFAFADTRGIFIYSPSVYGLVVDTDGDGL